MKVAGTIPQVYNAFKAAVEHKGVPTVILARPSRATASATGEGKNITHQRRSSMRTSFARSPASAYYLRR
jgi:pyruvate dehydrogenase complex dehydrogenase (E1) component